MNSDEIKKWIEQNGNYSFARSGGPGGQYVNTSDTKVILRIPVTSLPISVEEKESLFSNLANRINSEGELILHASSTRSQVQNRTLAEKLALKLILSTLKRKRKRYPTKPSKASRNRRLNSKKSHSRKKQLRKKPVV